MIILLLTCSVFSDECIFLSSCIIRASCVILAGRDYEDQCSLEDKMKTRLIAECAACWVDAMAGKVLDDQ